MSHSSPSTSNSSTGSSQSPAAASESSGAGRAKGGRPNKWTSSRQRELARLYLYSALPPKDIPKALKDSTDPESVWLPGKESTVKTVNTLLNNDPRWLRPKNREEMDQRIRGLSECKKQRARRRKWSPEAVQADEAIATLQFSETPLEDLLASAPEEPLKSVATQKTPLRDANEETASSSDDSRKVSSSSGSMPEIITPPDSDTQSDGRSFDERSLSTYISTSSLKKRLSQYSSNYVKAVARLMKAHSISDSSAAATTNPAYSVTLRTADDTATEERTIRSFDSHDNPFRPRPNLANVFLVLDSLIKRQGVCFPGLKAHDAGTCWCTVASVINDFPVNRIWVSGVYLDFDLRLRDKFGNSILHAIAARHADINAIVKALERGADPNALNAAGQNFLHVLPRRFLRSLSENDWNGLMWILQKLRIFRVQFQSRDAFGRTFFHLCSQPGNVLKNNELQVLQFLGIELLPLRDAFEWTPFNQQTVAFDPVHGFVSHEPGKWFSVILADRNIRGRVRSPFVEKGSIASALLDPTVPMSSKDQAFITKHARLIELARVSFDVPRIEDSEGRNGLQCLAEASLTLSIDSEEIHSRTLTKRKRGDQEPSGSSMRLILRHELVRQLVTAGVSLNNYDKEGNTVLMSFVTHLRDGEDDKTLAKILHYIIQSGADVRMRNRKGESALHIAVRRGRKIATRILLESGANVHAKDLDGKGVLAVGEVHYFKAKEDQPLYASIHACMALAIQYGAVAAPTLIQEWQLDEWSGMLARYVPVSNE